MSHLRRTATIGERTVKGRSMEVLHVCFADDAESGDAIAGAGGFQASALQLQRCSRRTHHQHHEQQRFKESSYSSSSSMSPPPTPRNQRNLGFFQQISRRFRLRSSDDLVNSCGEDDMQSSSTDSCSSSALGPLVSLDDYSPAIRAPTATANARNGAPGNSMEHISCGSSETSSTVDIDSDEHRQQALTQNGAQLQQRSSAADKEFNSLTRTSSSRLQCRSTSSLRRALECFSLSSRSLSCSTSSSHGSTPIKSSLNSAVTSMSSVDLPKRSAVMNGDDTASITVASDGVVAVARTGGGTSSVSKSKVQQPQRILRQPVSYTYLKGISGLPTRRVPRSSVCCQYARR